ncbi:MAG: hypothetical protein ACAI38_19685 [Myxococcota bacterium]
MRLQGLIIVSVALAACNAEEPLGGACGTDAPILEGEIVEGETAVDEIVRIERDGVCGSFQCLTEGGLAPYCTEECRYESSSSNATCTTDNDCSDDEEHCIDGLCRGDDCPSGFTCNQVQEAGPLRDKRYCTRQTGCLNNFDCGDVGNIQCVVLVCLDACLLANTSCEQHFLTCQPREEVPFCLCNGETEASNSNFCEAEALACQPPLGDAFPVGAAVLRGTCVGSRQSVSKTL